MLNRKLTMTAVAAAAGFALVACGGQDNAPAQNEQSNQQTNEQSQPQNQNQDQTQDQSQDQSSAETLSQDEAEQIALDDAGVTREDVTQWDRSELDQDDGVQMWEIEFDVNQSEYEYDIDAVSGDILQKDFDN